jgi:hypothetical protein
MTNATAINYDVEVSDRNPGLNLPQKMGTRLWAPMWVMALIAFAIGFILAIVRANEIAGSNELDTVASLNHLVPAFMFLGFMAVFAAVSFAVARILGAFRSGGGQVQEAAGTKVQTLKMPNTAKVFMGLMMMGMMVILISVIIHFVQAGSVDATEASLLASEQAAIRLEGFRRLGVAMYLAGIAFGLGTIITVLRFQAIRIRELAGERSA